MESPKWIYKDFAMINLIQNNIFVLKDFEHHWNLFQFLNPYHHYIFEISSTHNSDWHYNLLKKVRVQKCNNLKNLYLVLQNIDQVDGLKDTFNTYLKSELDKLKETLNCNEIILTYDMYKLSEAIELINSDIIGDIPNFDLSKIVINGKKLYFNNICFFGASVTGQQYGYFESINFKNKYKYSYSGCTIDNASFLVNNIINNIDNYPDICFLDWTTTLDYHTKNIDEHIECIISKLINNNITPIILYFYRKNQDSIILDSFKKISNKYNLIQLSFETIINNDNSKKYIKDDVHTNIKGSQIYGKIISKFLEEYYDSNLKNKLEKINFSSIYSGLTEKLIINSDLNIEEFNNEIYYVGKKIIINTDDQNKIYFIKILVGTHSGLINIKDKNKEIIINTWDNNCYYQRFKYLKLDSIGTIIITVLDDKIDTSSCKYDVDFSKNDKLLKISKYI